MKDFSENSTCEQPIGLMEYLISLVQKHRAYLEDQPENRRYKTKMTLAELKTYNFLDPDLLNKITRREATTFKYPTEKKTEAECLSII